MNFLSRWMRHCALLAACFLAIAWEAEAQQTPPDLSSFQLQIRKATGKITLDGRLDEADWKTADTATNFFCNFPSDTAYCKIKTEAWVTYDEVNFYVAARCQRLPGTSFVVTSLKRDFSFPASDGFAVFIDPSNDKTNGFAFSVNPLGVQREGLLQNGGNFGVTTDWDNRWFSEVTFDENEYVVEIAIPFKTLRYKAGSTEWHINFARNDLGANEQSTWVPVPRAFNVATLSFTGSLLWDQPLGKPGFNASVIPYALGATYADYTQGTHSTEPNGGVDVKLSVSPSLNLDLTVNPDFSQVEVDRQVTNLSRFSLFFPERRQFFIENSDLMAGFGFRAIRPFFSRRIGLDAGLAVPILAGARLSGKLNDNWRISAMDMLTEGGTPLGRPSQNFAVVALQRKVLKRSSVTAIAVNRTSFDGTTAVSGSASTVTGLEYNHASSDNVWKGKAFYLVSLDNQMSSRKGANAIWFSYQTRKWFLMYNHEWVGADFNAPVGFVPRVGYLRFEPEIKYTFLPTKGKISSQSIELYGSQYFNNNGWRFTDNELKVRYEIQFNNRMVLSANVTELYTWLFFPFDPTGLNQVPLQDSTGYHYRHVAADFTSDFRKKLNFRLVGLAGTYFDGRRAGFSAEVNYRAQPWGVFSLSADLNHFEMPGRIVNLLLISPRMELSFTRKLFFTTFFQFNTQTRNFNINARLQWRFKPMSDLFIVLTDNYLSDNFAVKNRALVVKLNYWFSL